MKPQKRFLTHNSFRLIPPPAPSPQDVVIPCENLKQTEFKQIQELERQASGKSHTAVIPGKLMVQKHCPSDVQISKVEEAN